MNLGQARVLCGFTCCILLQCQVGSAWSNRGHRTINLVAAETLPAEMPPFMRTRAAIAQIAYLGPEPDRWRPNIAPELNRVAGPDHFFRYEAGVPVGSLPRRRYDYFQLLENLRAQHPDQKASYTFQYTGTLPWGVEEVYERLMCAFFDYRLVTGELPASAGTEMVPMTKADLPQIEAAALFYAGWLGHYVGDGSMPLHDSVNIAGWVEKTNPNGYTTKGSIHHQLEVTADAALEANRIQSKQIEKMMPAPHAVSDAFAGTLDFVRREGMNTEQVYRWEKQGSLSGAGTKEVDDFIAQRMAEGGTMLRDLIYSAWLQSKLLEAPAVPDTVTPQGR